MNHPFFATINFEKLQQKSIDAPFKPAVEQMTYTEEKIDLADPNLISIKREEEGDIIPEDKKLLIEINQKKFQNF